MGQYQLKPSFAAGELTPALYGRTDLQKYDVGAALLQNAVVLRYGGVSRRAGFEVMAEGGKGRLIPFSYNTEQNYVLEFTDRKVRVFKNDSHIPIAETSTPYLEADLAKIKYTQSADMLFLVHPKYKPATLTRYSENNWVYAEFPLKNGAFNDVSTSEITITPSGVSGTITLTASASFFTSTMVGTLMRIGHVVPSQYQKGNPLNTEYIVSCVPNASVYVESFGFWNGSFIVSAQEEDGTWTQLKKQSGNRSQNYNMTFTNETDVLRNYKVTSTEFDTSVRENEDASQRGYVTIQSFAKSYDGIVKITAITSATVATAEVVRTLGAKTATSDISTSAWDSVQGYPQTVGFFEDRLVFAGSPSKPQTYWASKTGDYNNFGVSTPQQDDDAITGTLSSGQMNGIQAIVSFGEMIMLTSGGEYRVGGSNGEAFKPTSQQARAQEYRGVNELTPVVIGGRIIYVQRDGRVIRDLAYAYDVDKYTGDDVSILANHLFDGHKIVGITYQQSPDSIVWCVREDGVLLGMTYIKEQDVYAWHRHTTDGKFIDVCSIPSDGNDVLWAIVERNGTYYVERMAERDSDIYLDFSSVFSYGSPVKEITGITWQKGMTVEVIADGVKLPMMVVPQDGKISFDKAYSRIVIGIPYETEIKTLPIEVTGQDGTWGSRKKRIQNMTVQFSDTIGGMFGYDENHLDEIKWRTTEPFGQGVRPFTGKKNINLPLANYDETLMIIIKQIDPYPMTVLSIIPEVIAGG